MSEILSDAQTRTPGTLYVVATPIGNLEDLTFRALRILQEVDLVAAEDTRHSRKLFNHYGIKTALTSYFEHNELSKSGQLVNLLASGKSIALITDAGTPAISDPGFLLVQRCHAANIPVASVPGPSAVITALSIAGLPTDRFVFEGFLPTKQKARSEKIINFLDEERTVVCYESPRRLLKTLEMLLHVLGDQREVAVVRELTKLHEEVFSGQLPVVIDHFVQSGVRGEVVLVIAPPVRCVPVETVQQALVRLQAETVLPMRQIVKQVAKQFGLPGSDVYKESLQLKESEGQHEN
ncbi:MAG: 16S rRNA (cytidine(1402)-2'-O)-methyltransferase [Desulfuromonadales bacterium]|nr:16S rRNA (cytidine(1402)-2'-O)-methyltransferase [Desulfuromonadales bacterium]